MKGRGGRGGWGRGDKGRGREGEGGMEGRSEERMEGDHLTHTQTRERKKETDRQDRETELKRDSSHIRMPCSPHPTKQTSNRLILSIECLQVLFFFNDYIPCTATLHETNAPCNITHSSLTHCDTLPCNEEQLGKHTNEASKQKQN